LAGGPTSPASASDLEKAITPDVASADIHAVIGGAEPRTFAPNSAPGLGRRKAVQACDFSYLSAMTRHPKSEPKQPFVSRFRQPTRPAPFQLQRLPITNKFVKRENRKFSQVNFVDQFPVYCPFPLNLKPLG